MTTLEHSALVLMRRPFPATRVLRISADHRPLGPGAAVLQTGAVDENPAIAAAHPVHLRFAVAVEIDQAVISAALFACRW